MRIGMLPGFPSHQQGRRRFVGAAAAGLGLALADRLGWAASAAFPAATITRTLLGNGLEVVLHETRRRPEVAVFVAYGAGSRDDPPGIEELAHLVEHLTFAGSRHLSPYQGMSLLESLGGRELNGVTSPDTTVYTALVPSTALATALWIESERMAFTLERFTDSSLAIEKATIEREHALQNSGDVAFNRWMLRAIFGTDHPYGRAASLTPNVRAATLGDAQSFYERYYRPDNARLILVGDFESAAALSLVEKYFATVRAPQTPLSRAKLRPTTTFAAHKLTMVVRPEFMERLTIIYPAPVPLSREDAVLEVFASVLEQRLRQRLLRATPLAADARVSRDERDGCPLVVVDVVVAVRNRMDEVEAEVKQAIGATWAADWKTLLPNARRAAKLARLRAVELPFDLAEQQLLSLRFQGRPLEPAQYTAECDAVSPKDIDALRRYFLTQRLGARRVRGRGDANGSVEVK